MVKGVNDWTERDTYTIIYKEDGSLWFREEVGKNRKPADWKKIDDHVVQYSGDRRMYLTQSGELKSLYIDDDNGDYYYLTINRHYYPNCSPQPLNCPDLLYKSTY